MEKENSEKKKVDRLVFIYDANSGKMGAFWDSAKKVLMIKGCALCTITHGILGEKNEWKACQQELGVPITYYHKDEIPEHLKGTVTGHLPCILAHIGRKYVMLLEPEVLDRCRGDVADLKGRIHYYLTANNLRI
jgi:hypothetical protein